jgi:hypothetical protein
VWWHVAWGVMLVAARSTGVQSSTGRVRAHGCAGAALRVCVRGAEGLSVQQGAAAYVCIALCVCVLGAEGVSVCGRGDV